MKPFQKASRRIPHALCAPLAGSRGGAPVSVIQRQTDRESGAGTHLADYRKRPAVRFRDPAADRKSKARPAVRSAPRALNPVEAVEDSLQVLRRDTSPRILHADHGFRSVKGAGGLNRPARRCEAGEAVILLARRAGGYPRAGAADALPAPTIAAAVQPQPAEGLIAPVVAAALLSAQLETRHRR